MNNKTSKYPSREECLKILNKIGCPKRVINHLLTVTDLALKIAKRFPKADLELVEAGGLLHDMGRSKTHGITHAVEGAKMARELGLPVEINKIIERHICAGIPKMSAIELGLPARDYIPITIEEKIIAHADNLVEGERRCTISRSVQILQNQGLFEVAERVRQLHVELSEKAGIDIDNI